MTDQVPYFSIITPVFNTDPVFLEQCIASVLDQSFGDWELIIVNDCSTSPETMEVLQRARVLDPRISVIDNTENRGIVYSSNVALARRRGEWIALLDHDDALEPTALATMKTAVEDHPMVDYLYSDEFYLHPDGTVVEFKKPDWSPERLRCQMYTCHLSVVRSSLIEAVGGFRAGFDGSQDHDFILRVTEKARGVHHVRRSLYYWRVNPDSFSQVSETRNQSFEAGRRAVQEHCDRVAIQATVSRSSHDGVYRVERHLSSYPRVSVIIPTRGSDAIVWGRSIVPVVDCVREIRTRSTYQNLEYVIVVDADTPTYVRARLTDLLGSDLKLVEYGKSFNFSEKINFGAVQATSEFFLLLNDDTRIINDDWLEPMLGLAQQDDVGTVGNMLLFEDSRLQHGGHCFDHGNPTHIAFKEAVVDGGFAALFAVDREVSGNSAACCLVKRTHFFAVGGLSLDFGNNYNDVDFGCKLSRLGLRHVWTPHSRMFHFESLTRDPKVTEDELSRLHDRWSLALHDEKYYQPHEWDFSELPPRRLSFSREWKPRRLADA
jgi:glycosyltransferase involved in cell wall biosynthesis